MGKNINKLFLAIGLACLAFYFYTKSQSVDKDALPQLTETLMNGDAFDIQSLSGNIVLIDFWGSWCPPCREENPILSQMYGKYHDKNFQTAKNFEIVSIAIERNDKRVNAAIEKDGLNWPYHILQVSKIVLASPLARKYGVTDLPTKFLYDGDGKLIGKNMTLTEIDTYLANQIKN